MIAHSIQEQFQEKIAKKVSLYQEDIDRFRILNPFCFNDGDHFSMVLKKDDIGSDSWIITDEGDTFTRLTDKISENSLREGNRARILENTLSMFNVIDRDGEFLVKIKNERYADALYDLIQALVKISDITYLSRENVRSTFLDDFKSLISETVPQNRYYFDWTDADLDPQKLYKVDCRINKMQKPLMIFALQNDSRVKDATISLQKFKEWDMQFLSMAIFEKQENIGRSVLARFTDVCGYQYSSLDSDDKKTAIAGDILEIINTNNN